MLGNYIKNKRLQATLLLGFASGLPIALTSSTLQAWFTQAGVSIATIGALTLIGLPYVWKFLWAPAMDRFIPPWGGRRRGWILITQIGLCISLLIIARLNPAIHPSLIGIVALFIAFTSASQDIAVDAYRTDILQADERGLGAAAVTFGFRIAMLVSGGLALIMADHIGWQSTYQIMALLMALMAVVTYFAPEVTDKVQGPKTFYAAIIEPFKNLLQRENITLILLFIVLYKIGDAFALSLMSNFLLRGLEFSLTDVGIAFKIFGLIATILGVLFGGIFLVRVNIYSALLWFGLLQAFSNLMFVLLAMMGKNYFLMVSAIFIESFCSGMSTAAFVAFLMSLCDHRYSATQYACLSALFAMGRVFAGPIAARIVEHFGWINFYWFAFMLSFPGLIFLTMLRGRMKTQNVEAMV